MNSKQPWGHVCKERVIYCTAPDPYDFYARHPEKLLEVFVLASKGNTIHIDTYHWVNVTLSCMLRLTKECLRDGIGQILLSDCPEALEGMLQTGVFSVYGLEKPSCCLRVLRDVPPTPVLRWWALSKLCGSSAHNLTVMLGLSPDLADTMQQLDVLADTSPLPEDIQQLKQFINTHVFLGCKQVHYGEFARIAARFYPAWCGQETLYENLQLTGEPYRIDQLAIHKAELEALGWEEARILWVMHRWLDAVIKVPAINTRDGLKALMQPFSDAYDKQHACLPGNLRSFKRRQPLP